VISGSVDVPQLIPEYVTAIPHPVRLIDLFPSRLAIDSMAYEYFRQTKRTNNAAPVPDNALKPTSILTVQAITDRARVIAHLSEPLPFRIWLDMDAITSWLYAEMSAGVLDATEFQAINGVGTGENCEGVLHVPGTTAVPFAAHMVTTLRAAGEVPTGWALSPANAEAIDLVRWGSAGGFLSGGFEHDNRDGFGTSDNIFGTVPRVVSPSVPTGTAILGDWTQLKLFIREQMRIDLDASGVLFQQNQIQLRAESRVGVGILRPQAFAICDLTAGTTTRAPRRSNRAGSARIHPRELAWRADPGRWRRATTSRRVVTGPNQRSAARSRAGIHVAGLADPGQYCRPISAIQAFLKPSPTTPAADDKFLWRPWTTRILTPGITG
jgi:Phage capsid family